MTVDGTEPEASGPYPDLGGAFTPLFQRLRELGVARRVEHMGKVGPRGRSADFIVDDPEAFVRELEQSGRCCIDTPAGRILHRGKTSLREDRRTNGLHVAMEQGGHVLAHLDRFSPVSRATSRRTCRYSPPRVLIHNAARLAGDLVRFVFGHRVDCAPLLLSLETAGVELPARGVPREERPDPPAAAGPRPVLEALLAAEASPGVPAPPEAPQAHLPFSAIDEAVRILDGSEEPWTLHWEARVEGRLDAGRLGAAVRDAMGRHPLARARAAGSDVGARAHRWEVVASPDVDPVVAVDCPDEASLAAARDGLQSFHAPLAAAPPFRLAAARHPGGDVLILNMSHTVTDARGALRLLRSIARAYAGEADPVPEVDLVSARGIATDGAVGESRTRFRRLRVLANSVADLFALPARVAGDGGRDASGYGIHQLRLSSDLTESLLRAGTEGVNDVLVAALHLSIALWNIEHGVRCGRVSVLVPVDLRPPALRDEVVGNFSVLARVVTTPEQRSLAHVLPVVAEQTGRKDVNTVGVLVELLARSVSWPGWASRWLPALLSVTGNRLVDTAALSYAGCPDAPSFGHDAGKLLELWFSPPARMPLGLSVGAVIAAGHLHLAFRYRHTLMGADAARRFADRYLVLLGHLLDPGRDDRAAAPPPRREDS